MTLAPLLSVPRYPPPLMAEPGFGKKRAEPFGQRASAHVHVHAHTLASQGGLRSLLRTTGNMGLVGARRQRGV